MSRFCSCLGTLRGLLFFLWGLYCFINSLSASALVKLPFVFPRVYCILSLVFPITLLSVSLCQLTSCLVSSPWLSAPVPNVCHLCSILPAFFCVLSLCSQSISSVLFCFVFHSCYTSFVVLCVFADGLLQLDFYNLPSVKTVSLLLFPNIFSCICIWAKPDNRDIFKCKVYFYTFWLPLLGLYFQWVVFWNRSLNQNEWFVLNDRQHNSTCFWSPAVATDFRRSVTISR